MPLHEKCKNQFQLCAIPFCLIQPLYLHGFLPRDKSFKQDFFFFFFFVSYSPCPVRLCIKTAGEFSPLDSAKL